MKLVHLFENRFTKILDKIPGGRQLVNVLHTIAGVMNDNNYDTTTFWKVASVVRDAQINEDPIFQVYLIRGDLGWGVLYWEDFNNLHGRLAYLKGTELKTLNLTSLDIPSLKLIQQAIGSERDVIRFHVEDVAYLKRKHKSIRHIKDPDEAHDYETRMHQRDPGKLLPKDKSLDERLWVYSPRIFGNAKRHLRRLLDSGEWVLPNDFTGSDEELLFNVLDNIIDLKGSWFSPDVYYSNLHGENIENMWGEFVEEAMAELGHDSIKSGYTLDSTLINKILPILSKKVNGWITGLLVPKPEGDPDED